MCVCSQFDATTKYDDGQYDATAYDGSIWNANADALYADDASANDATTKAAAAVPSGGCNVNREPTSNGSEANVSRVQVSYSFQCLSVCRFKKKTNERAHDSLVDC